MVKSPPREPAPAALSMVNELDRVSREQASRMWRALTVCSGNRDLAQDAVSEAFAQAIGRGTAIRSPERWGYSYPHEPSSPEKLDASGQDGTGRDEQFHV